VERELEIVNRLLPPVGPFADTTEQVQAGSAERHGARFFQNLLPALCRALAANLGALEQRRLRFLELTQLEAAQREDITVVCHASALQDRECTVRVAGSVVALGEQIEVIFVRVLGVEALAEKDGVIVQIELEVVLDARAQDRLLDLPVRHACST
jgi:hypothetical protein